MPYGANKRSDYLFVVTLSVAVLLYLLTDSTLAAVVLPCMHGGWNTLHTGIWLLRSDPHRRRGRVCFAFYVAAACWKAAAAAFVSIIVFRIVEDRLGAKPNMAEFETTMFVLAGGVVFTTLIGLVNVRSPARSYSSLGPSQSPHTAR